MAGRTPHPVLGRGKVNPEDPVAFGALYPDHAGVPGHISLRFFGDLRNNVLRTRRARRGLAQQEHFNSLFLNAVTLTHTRDWRVKGSVENSQFLTSLKTHRVRQPRGSGRLFGRDSFDACLSNGRFRIRFINLGVSSRVDQSGEAQERWLQLLRRNWHNRLRRIRCRRKASIASFEGIQINCNHPARGRLTRRTRKGPALSASEVWASRHL